MSVYARVDVATSNGRATARDVALVVAAKTAVSLLVLASGFRALSDDDYSRIVIAQRFAAAPSLDPSGTSWLPFPFWVQGAAMLVFGRSVEFARATAFVLGLCSAALVYVAGHFLELPRRTALAAALIGAAFPYAAWLGVATVPEGLTAACVIAGAASASSLRPRTRLYGAALLFAATLSRYEAWPVALGFAAYSVFDAWKRRSPALAAAAIIAFVGPVAWMIHGAVRHHDALFFVARVARYREALGAATPPAFLRLFAYPVAAVSSEPELAGFAALAIGVAFAIGERESFRRYTRLSVLLLALLVFLVIGDAYGGAPTHHAARTLLPVWLGAALVGTDAFRNAWVHLDARSRARLLSAMTVAIAIAAVFVRPRFTGRESFVDRSAEVDIGRTASRHIAHDEQLVIDTSDFGFFAVIAGFGRPERAVPLDDHDPRKPRPGDAFRSPSTLRATLDAAGARFLVAQSTHTADAAAVGKLWAQNPQFALIERR